MEHSIAKAQEFMDRMAPKASASQWKPAYHITAPSGWINDPNGLCQMNGVYHVFFQLHPYSPKSGPMYWGHVSGTDLVHWKYEPIALAPDQPYEQGCWSGSGVNDHGILTLMYTADLQTPERKESQCIARSFDGGHTFIKSDLNPVIPEWPAEGTFDFRDPKVWKCGDEWRVVVGSGKDGTGKVFLYASKDLEHWTYRGVMCESDGTQGFMWECPNFCAVDGRDVLIFSPMGMLDHKNVYMVGEYNDKTGKFVPEYLREIDYGSAFYAAQVFTDESGRTILFSWMNNWDKKNSTEQDGWTGQLTIPRLLHLRGTQLLQQPVPELSDLRVREQICCETLSLNGKQELPELIGDKLEIRFRIAASADKGDLSFCFRGKKNAAYAAALKYDASEQKFAFVTADLPEEQIRWIPLDPDRREEASRDIDVYIYLDASSAEVFIDEGAIVFSEVMYPEKEEDHYLLTGNGVELKQFRVWELGEAF